MKCLEDSSGGATEHYRCDRAGGAGDRSTQGRSVSALLADELRELVAQDEHYAAARKCAIALLSTFFALSGEFHERRRLRSRCCCGREV